MGKRSSRRRPLFTVPQILVILAILAFLIIAIDFNRRERSSQLLSVNESELQAQIDVETTRQVELQATLTYIESDAYIASYARNEAGYMLPGEERVVVLPLEVTPEAPPPPAPTPDPAIYARPWQAWWQLLFDAPLPGRN